MKICDIIDLIGSLEIDCLTGQKQKIFESTGGQCFYCGKSLSFGNNVPGKSSQGWGSWQVEHLKSRSQGKL